MRMYDCIDKKKKGESLKKEEIEEMIQAYVKDEIPDYQMAAFLMAVYFQGMREEELVALTDAMVMSGEKMDLSSIEGIKVDKHSTGGVGDKTTLVIGAVVAACGGKVAKMSGRGLGFTGGTIDKLEAIPGFCTNLSKKEFFRNVNTIGVSVMSQSDKLVRADKKLYALRDVTAVVDSIPLIAASVMSKKIAAGSDCILLDVTTGSGAFMKKREDAICLAKTMVSIGKHVNLPTLALITNMDEPLGNAIGNNLEVIEAMEVLKGKGPKDVREICIQLSAYMLYLGGIDTLEQCEEKAKKSLIDGTAFEKFYQMVKVQGGDTRYIEEINLFPKAPYHYDMIATASGYITHMDAEQFGIASMVLGAGRRTKESQIDFTAGIYLHKKVGDRIEIGEVLFTLYSSIYEAIKETEKILKRSFWIGEEKIENKRLMLDCIGMDEIFEKDIKRI